MEYLTLNNGIKCPAVGIGTYMLSTAVGAALAGVCVWLSGRL